MAAAFNRVQVGMRKTGTTTTVPDDPRGRLMYYISCMSTVLDLDDDTRISRYRNYSNYANMDLDDCKVILILAILLEPRDLMGKVIFQEDAMCPDAGNEFYELSAVNTTLAVSDSVIIGGQRRHVKSIMCFKLSWLEKNFLTPLVELKRIIDAADKANKSSCCTIL